MDINILLFNNFETLDAFGPAEILGKIDGFKLDYYSLHGGEVKSSQNISVVTKKISDAKKNGVLVVPGGMGTRTLVNDLDFINTLREALEEAKYCLSICTGSALLAKTGILDGKRATSNKIAYDWAKSNSLEVEWIRKARWVVDGKFYTSSGVSAGMDMTLGFISDLFSEDFARDVARRIEYIWNSDKDVDPFA